MVQILSHSNVEAKVHALRVVTLLPVSRLLTQGLLTHTVHSSLVS